MNGAIKNILAKIMYFDLYIFINFIYRFLLATSSEIMSRLRIIFLEFLKVWIIIICCQVMSIAIAIISISYQNSKFSIGTFKCKNMKINKIKKENEIEITKYDLKILL
jgi:hypothetical protein